MSRHVRTGARDGEELVEVGVRSSVERVKMLFHVFDAPAYPQCCSDHGLKLIFDSSGGSENTTTGVVLGAGPGASD